jgi:salicylate hydroxylase
MSKSDPLKVLIAGAGIGGLTAALALAQRGFDVEVYEQAGEVREVGAGVQVGPSAMRIFHALGLMDAVMTVAAQPIRSEFRMWNTAEAWKRFDLGPVSVATYGFPYVTLYRPDLLGVLVEALESRVPMALHLGARVIGHDQDGTATHLHLADGRRIAGDVLIGADGIHSVIRGDLFGPSVAEFTGLVAWRGTIPIERLPERLRAPISAAWIGPYRHAVQYPLRRGELMNLVGVVERTDWRDESWTTRGTHADMAHDFKGWHADVHTMMAAIEQPFLWALILRKPLPRWSVGHVTLLGDAAHPTLPFLASGAVMAIEDGFVLARALERYGADLKTGLGAYERARLERTSRVVKGSADNAGRFHNQALSKPDTAQAFFAAEFTPERLRERYDWLYSYDATQVQI